MFYELIYTRCKNGFDIAHGGKKIIGEGYKIYSCSPEIYSREGLVDLNFLINAAQNSQINSFMDEAYLYYVPDFGENFLVNFYPVPFNPEHDGNYTKKPGNFLNQILIGNFSIYYLWQFFGDKKAWYAKEKNEAYYYSVDPIPTEARNIVPSGIYNFEAIKNFISNGRENLLKKAVAFIIYQYSLNISERKYLVIKDTSVQNIELWIAAIECAFSPRMAANISFATRLNKYITSNPYTIKDKKFQPVANYQDNKQNLRFRAMIVGVNVEDTSAKVLTNSQFAVLDGVNMEAGFEVDTNHKYFNVITKFDDQHKNFCMKFLQNIELNSPVADLPILYEIYINSSDLSIEALIKWLSNSTISKLLPTLRGRLVTLPASRFLKNIDGLKEIFGVNSDVEFVQWLQNTNYINESAKPDFYIAIDEKITYNNDLKLAKVIQQYKHKNTICKNSANVLGLDYMRIAVKTKPDEFLDVIKIFTAQNFPCMTDKKFVADFARYFIDINLTQEEINYFFEIIFDPGTPKEILIGVVRELIHEAKKNKDKLNYFLSFLADIASGAELLSNEILATINPQKILESLESLVIDENISFFNDVKENVNFKLKSNEKVYEKISSIFRKSFFISNS